MRSIAGGLLLALVLIAAGVLCLAESRHSQRLAEAQRRLATLQYTDEGDLASDATPFNRLPPPIGVGEGYEARHQAVVSYWLNRYTSLQEMTSLKTSAAPTDSALLMLAANAAYRTSAPQSADRKLVVARLDTVAQAYADVLRADPSQVDAAFNYEFVIRMRDAMARSTTGRVRTANTPAGPDDESGDLPPGPTIHGKPGGPPPETPMSDFKTITPMRYDEREEQTDPGRGQKIQRKG